MATTRTFTIETHDDWMFRYVVLDEDGNVINLTTTKWGARRSARKYVKRLSYRSTEVEKVTI